MASRLTGQSIERVEDARLLTGQGRFVGGLDRAGLLHAAFVRSSVAHARLVSVDASRARQAPGVVAIFDGDDIAATMTGPMAVMGPPALKTAPYWPLARGKVRVVGDPVAIVIADTKAHAVDAADLVEVTYDALAPVITFEQARDPSRPALWDETGTNVIYEDNTVYGKPFAEVAAGAAHVVRRRYTQHRYAHVPIEGRGAIADYSNFAKSLDYDMANKRPHSLKMSLSTMLGIPYPNVHARSGDIGGAFGSKGQTTREDIALGAAAKLLGRSIKWIEERGENLQAAGHAREENVDIEAVVAADGRVLGLRVAMEIDVGAYPMLPFPASMFAGMVRALLPNALRLESYEFSTTTLMTNKGSYIAYRAPWTIETVVRERLLDEIAREVGLDVIDIRRVNLVRAEDQPTRMITGVSMTGVTIQECLEHAVAVAGLAEFRVAQEKARGNGHYLGIGFSSFVEIAPGPPDFAKSLGFDLPSETAWARVEPTGDVVIQTWQVNHGQGHETTLGQVVADEMGVPLARVRIEWGSSDNTPFNTMSTGGSRSATMGAGAAKMATRAVKQKVLQIAAQLLEANADDLEIVDGAISVRGTPAKAVTMADVARLAWFAPSSLPAGMTQGLEASVDFKVPPNGGWVSACHVCWVDIDVETGHIDIPRYLVVEDCGDLINPAIVDGQIRGGVIQGIASVLHEKHIYDDEGQLLTSSLTDYLVPAACDVPVIDIEHLHSPPQHEVNSRGVGEGGLLGAPAAVLNAVADALAPFGVAITETHLPPQRVRQLIEQATQAAQATRT